MKIRIVGGKITAEAQTASDMKVLLGYASESAPVKKHKKPCPKCGKRVKHMSLHNTVMHGAGRLLGSVRGDMARATPITRVS